MMKLVPVFLLFTSFIFAQTRPYYYPVETSLADHHINAIEQDAFGRLILGTDKGIFTFNGFQSRQIPCPKLYSKDILQLIRIGDRFFGLNRTGQVFEVKQNQVALLTTSQIKSPIIRLDSTKAGAMRIVCPDAVYVFQLKPFKQVDKIPVPFYEKGKSELIDYCETEKGRFALLSGNELVDIDEQTSRTLPGMTGRWLAEENNKLVIFPTRPNSNISLQYSNKRFKNLHKLIGAFNHSIQKVQRIGQKVYLLSETGMIVLKAGEMRVNSVILGLHVTAVFQDQNQNTWFGTRSKGLYCIPYGSYKLLNSAEFSYLENYRDEIIARTISGEMMILNRFGKKVRTALQKEQGKQAADLVSVPVILADELVKEIIPLDPGAYLVASSKGLFKVAVKNKKKFRALLADPAARTEIFASPIKDLVRSDTTEILFSNLEGLFTLDLRTLEYRPIRYFNENIDASQILFNRGKWYVLSSTNKIFTIVKGKITHEVNFRENGTNILVSKLKIYNNQFYILSDKTLYRTSNLNGNLERLQELSHMNDLFLRDFVVLDKKVYLATQFGLFEFKWEVFETNFPPFILGKPAGDHQSGKGPVFGAKNTEVVIPYELVELMGNHPYELQYRLIRNDETEQVRWSNTSLGLTRLTFEHLSSGNYRLELRLFDPGTKRFSKLNSTSFKINASWYEDTVIWFIAGILIGFFGLLYLKRRKRLKKMELK